MKLKNTVTNISKWLPDREQLGEGQGGKDYKEEETYR